MSATIQLDGRKRELLRYLVDVAFYGMGELNVSRAQSERRRIEFMFDLMDRIGWSEEDVRAPLVALELDDVAATELELWLRQERTESIKTLDYEREILAKARAGDPGYMVGGSVAATERASAQYTDDKLEDLLVLDRLLAQFGGGR